ncbi:MAG: hypothetical protein J7556_15020 [Acidovorax sp.]|nr:hypothetical protein [Acidovorax sp.]
MRNKEATGNATDQADNNKPADSRPRGRHKVDWEAVERDFRTGHFTLRELEGKHGVSYAQISRRSSKEGWTKDLREVIKQATDAALLRESVTDAQKDATETVLVAAELNKRVILGHRRDLSDTRDVAASLLQELSQGALLEEEKELLAQILAGAGAEPADEARARATVSKALSVNARIASVKQLADAFDKLQVAERRAFGLDEKVERQPNSLADMATDELKRMREALLNGG